MKSAAALVSLSLVAAVACGKKSSNNDDTSTTPNVIPIVKITPKPEANAPLIPAVKPLLSPEAGLYLGACSIEGSHGLASGVEVTSTQVFAVTALFSSTLCTPGTLSSWGHTADFASFNAYAVSVGEQSKTAGDEITTSFDAATIKFLSKAGAASSLTKISATLSSTQRFKIFVANLLVDGVNKTVTGTLELTKGPLIDGEFGIGFYCEDASKKILAQEVNFSTSAEGVTSFEAKLGSWTDNQVPAVTRCQATLTTIQKSGDKTSTRDVAWSQFLEIK